MSDHMRNKLGAFLDGELDSHSQNEVQAHLETCMSCQDDLEALRRISHLLRADPQPDFIPALDFKKQLMLQLPRRAEVVDAHPNSWKLPWIAPVLVLAGWIFFQVAVHLSTIISLFNQIGMLDSAVAWTSGNPQQTLWFNVFQAVVGSALNPPFLLGFKALNDASLIAQNMVIPFFRQVGVAVLYWGVLTLLWQTKLKEFWGSYLTGDLS